MILNKLDYIAKVDSILNDPSKFLKIDNDWLSTVISKESKVNKHLQKMKNNDEINDSQYQFMYATGTRPGILYGLPKIHKMNCPVRPILFAIGTAGYNIAKFLLPFLAIT